MFGLTQKLIHQIQEQSEDSECNQEIKLSHNVTMSLCTALQNLSFQFRNLQSSYLNSENTDFLLVLLVKSQIFICVR